MTILQLNPQIPLVTPMGGAQCVAIIDYSEEHDLKFVCILDEGGAVFTFQNKDVKGYANPTMGRTKQEGKPALPDPGHPFPPRPKVAPELHLSEAFCMNWLSAPNACAHLLNTALDPDHMRAAAKQIEEGRIQWSPPEYMEGATFGQMIEPMTDKEAERALVGRIEQAFIHPAALAKIVNDWLKQKQENRK